MDPTGSILESPRTLSRERLTGALAGSVAMAFVGGSVAVSGLLLGAPMYTAQSLRYALACVLLVAFARMTGRRLHWPRATEWLWLVGVAATGLLLFNVALVQGSAHAEPAVLAVAVASVPIVLGIIGPLLERDRPAPRLILAAIIVTAGAALVQGFGRSDLMGLFWAAVVLGCEAAFTLLAVPVLGRQGPIGVSVWTTAIAALAFAILGIGIEGPAASLHLDRDALLATLYLAVAVTALAFVLWYGAVERLGVGRAGLLTGIAPLSAAVVGAALHGALPALAVWVGLGLVGIGLTVGLRARR